MGKPRYFSVSLRGPWTTAEFYGNASRIEHVGETDSNFAAAGDIAERTCS
jgi:hypothetical protein